MKNKLLYEAACHEFGHAIFGIISGVEIAGISLYSNAGIVQGKMYHVSGCTDELGLLLSGIAMESVISGKRPILTRGTDIARAKKISSIKEIRERIHKLSKQLMPFKDIVSNYCSKYGDISTIDYFELIDESEIKKIIFKD